MAFVLKDRVQETCNAPGTGTITLLGAAIGYQTFSAAIGNGNTTYYAIVDQGGSNWEVGYGTYSSAGNTLARTTVLSSSNSGSLVNFSSGVQNVWVDYPAPKAAWLDINGDISQAIRNISGITGAITTPESITFDTNPAIIPTATGSIFWDAGNKSPSIVLDADVSLQLGQENVALVYNGTGSTITNGSVVAVAGAQGQRPSVVLADADSEALSAPTLGIATEDIANGAEGFVTTFGFVRGLNTAAFTAGLPIYLSQTAGQFTQTRPAAPAHTVILGWVIKVNASSGEVFVNINNGWELDELHNVLITSPTGGQLLAYDQTNSYWKNINLGAGTGFAATAGTGGTLSIGASVAAVGTWMGTPSSANLAAAMTDETGSGLLVFNNTPTFISPLLGTPTSGNLSNCTNLPAGQLTGTIPSAVLGNSTLFVGTTAIALNRASANLALTGLLSGTFQGATSGSVQLIPAAIAGTGTVLTMPATTGTIITSGDTGTVTNTMLAGSIANAKLLNSSVTFNGVSVALGASGTITATATNALTIGTGLSGTSYNGSAAVTIANTGVLSLSGGTTGLTPNTATTGAITLAGTLNVANGGTGLTSLTANRIPYGNGTSAFQSSANLTFNGTTLVVSDITDSSLTAGRVTFAGASGNLTDSANFTWDNTNSRLGIGTASPSQALQVTTGGDTAALISSSASATGNSARVVLATGVKSFALQNFNENGTAAGSSFRLFDDTRTAEVWRVDNSGNLLLGTATAPTGGATTQSIVANGAIYANNGPTGGYWTSTFGTGVSNNIWAFGNAINYGLKYFQGTAGTHSIDTIGFPFGQTTAATSFFQFIGNGSNLGALVMPKQPAFRAALTNSGDQTLTNTVLAFNVEIFDKSGNYDPSTATFTAPVSGTYFFYVQTYGTSSAGAATMSNTFQVNGSSVGPANGDIWIGGTAGRVNIAPIQTSMTINLAAGNTVRVFASAYNDAAIYRIFTGNSIFTGWLIG